MGMTAARKIDWISPEEYLASEINSPIKREYVNGYVYAMAGSINRHNRIAINLCTLLDQLLGDGPCVAINSDTKIQIKRAGDRCYYYPDGGVVCDENPETDHFQDNPKLIFEVLSQSTQRLDRGEKLVGYQSIPSLQSYLLIEQDKPQVVHYRRTKSGFRRTEVSGLDATVSIPSLSLELPLARIYRRISFAAE